jgi:membrane-associated phospholipid phosphatase
MKKNPTVAAALAAAFALALAGVGWADEVTDWHQMLSRSGIMTNPATSPLVSTRIGAIFSAAVFDAVNDGRYAPVHVPPGAPAGASRRAAAVQAAYASLLLVYPTAQYPSLKTTLDGMRAASLAVIAADRDESASSVANGIAWGQSVAEAIVAWRSTDGFTPAPPPFLGGTAVGEWRPTPPGLLPGAGPQFATMTPWVISSPSQFRPAGPPDLTSARYASDLNETKSMGRLTSPTRTADQTVYSLFWNSTTPVYLWDRVAISLLGGKGRWPDEHRGGHDLVRNARLLAVLNLAMADAAIACWEAKYHYVFWRPITAIALADTDGNPATDPDPSWLPLFATPAFPEYPSGHSTVSGAAATVLARFFGERTRFQVDSDLLLGVVRSFPSFSDALDEVRNARVFAGIHFRSACVDGQAVGVAVGNYVLAQALQRLGNDEDDDHDGRHR